MSKGKSIATGTNVVIASLFMQIVFFAFFLLTELKFAFKVNSVVFSSGRTTNTWKTLNYTLLFTSLLILIRSVVRVVEFIQGFGGYIAKHEIYIYVFDAVLMFLVLLASIVTMPFGSIFKLEAQCSRAGAYWWFIFLCIYVTRCLYYFFPLFSFFFLFPYFYILTHLGAPRVSASCGRLFSTCMVAIALINLWWSIKRSHRYV